jgi:hypothetical protein
MNWIGLQANQSYFCWLTIFVSLEQWLPIIFQGLFHTSFIGSFDTSCGLVVFLDFFSAYFSRGIDITLLQSQSCQRESQCWWKLTKGSTVFTTLTWPLSLFQLGVILFSLFVTVILSCHSYTCKLIKLIVRQNLTKKVPNSTLHQHKTCSSCQWRIVWELNNLRALLPFASSFFSHTHYVE